MSVLEAPATERLLESMLDRLPAFVPGWQPSPGGPGHALLEVYADYLHVLAERIAAAPDKNKMAFLDMLGLDVLPAQAARAPVVFTTIPGGGDGRAPAGTRLAAKGADPERQLVFETERAVGLAQARVAEVVSVWPGRDSYADHTHDALGGRPFTLWSGLQRVAHELYLAHDLHFALAGESSVGIEVELSPAGSERLGLDWSWWDGKGWRPFKDFADEDASGSSLDGTLGLTRNGRIRLATDCGSSAQRVVGGWRAHWLRARTTEALPPDASRRLAEIDRISLKTVIDRRLPEDYCDEGLAPDSAFAGGEQLDVSKAFFPLGKAPSADIAFYMACEEAFARPGAHVEICFDRAKTEQERLDEELLQYGLDVTSAVKHVLDAARKQSFAIQKIAEAIIAMAPPGDGGAATATALKSALATTTNALSDMSGLDAVATAGKALADSLPGISINLANLQQTEVDVPASKARVQNAANHAADAVRQAQAGIAGWVDAIGPLTAAGFGGPPGVAAWIAINLFIRSAAATRAVIAAATVIEDLGDTTLGGAIGVLQGDVDAVPPDIFNVKNDSDVLVGLLPNISVDLVYKQVSVPNAASLISGRATAKARDLDAATAGDQALIELAKLSPLEAALAAGKPPPELDEPVLAWEYWDGSRWRELVRDETDPATNMRSSGRIAFDVPPDWESSAVSDVEARWLRARLVDGAFGKLTLVSWKDQDNDVHYMPVIEPRPPQLNAFHLGYYWESEPSPPEHTLTHNDFRWEEHSDDAAWRGATFPPFRPMDDLTPALYVGFDGALPADELGLFLDVEERLGDERGPALAWERCDGSGWERVAVEDETAGLAVPGIARVVYPGDDWPQRAAVTTAEGREIALRDARAAAAFASGDEVWLAKGEKGELATVDDVAAAVVRTRAPLQGSYQDAALGRAGLARFGTPRSWIRARLREDGEPRRTLMRGPYSNATWAAQVETVTGELLGSSTGEADQAFFLTRTPVLVGQVIEVRELEGERAHVEYPLLLAELEAAGIRETDLVVDRDPRTGHESAVWVPWEARPQLGFSGPGTRHYTIERTRGRVRFGDGRHGRVPPAGRDNVRARRYRSSQNAETGNVPAGAISRVVSGVVVASVTNPHGAEGGAGSEPDAAVLTRGPLTVRNRRQAVTSGDYEALAREASPAVAVARATTRRGAVTVAVVPRSADPQPAPSYELRREVRSFLSARMPAAAGTLRVVPPAYFEVGVSATVVPVQAGEAGPVAAAARAALERFLHPLTGGPDGDGWPFGRDLYLSDVASLLERVPGLDYVADLALVVDGAPQAERVVVPAERLAAAGAIDVTLGGGEG